MMALCLGSMSCLLMAVTVSTDIIVMSSWRNVFVGWRHPSLKDLGLCDCLSRGE